MADSFNEFDDRLARISHNRNQMKRGYALTVDRDGLIVARPRSRRSGFPFKMFMMFVVGFVGFKILLVAFLGLSTYENRVANLQNGTAVEQVGAWFMQVDPVTIELAATLRPYIR
ncbi:hypothetical protein [Thalassovita sp.]|uniref:hypothetical protein n=1 Tax=Thalassovita sp. TaxID=1979401 RepID=UPI003B5BF078